LHHITIPKPEHFKSIASQTPIPNNIFIPIHRMLPAIKLDDQTLFKAYEIHNVTFDRLLATEFDSFHLPGPQVSPQSSFRICGIASKGFGV
jgi:hypothetical protein